MRAKFRSGGGRSEEKITEEEEPASPKVTNPRHSASPNTATSRGGKRLQKYVDTPDSDTLTTVDNIVQKFDLLSVSFRLFKTEADSDSNIVYSTNNTDSNG